MCRPIKTHPCSRSMQAKNLPDVAEPSAALDASAVRRPRSPRDATVPLDAHRAPKSLVSTLTVKRVCLKKRGHLLFGMLAAGPISSVRLRL